MKIITKTTLCLLITPLFLAGCAGGGYSDIDSWMKDQEKSLKGKIEPLPPAKTFSPVAFTVTEDPFVKKPLLTIMDTEKSKYAPDMDRRKEPLEAFPLNTLRMTGSLHKDGKFYAIIKPSDNIIHYVTLGNYLGNNFGKIIQLDESQIVLDERIKDSDEWKQKETHILLDDGDNKK